jgi:MFS family permease
MQVHGINLLSLRQAITPDHLQGRVNATFRFFNLGGVALGALVAAAMSQFFGLRAMLFVAAFGLCLPPLRIFLSPVPGLRSIDEMRAPTSETQ